jgi:ubiquinone/menaquinone biosynthesis C-methylase UbiE
MPTDPSEAAVKARYAAGAQAREASLCCPVTYDPAYLEAIPAEVIERDYGCGDPSRFVRPGETVLDLGSGTGKVCFIACQVVGARGRVIGIDMTDEMLEVARRNAPLVAAKTGFANVEFRKGRIQDLALDIERLDGYLRAHPVASSDDFAAAEAAVATLRRDHPLVADASVDVVVSNCVLNLVGLDHRRQLFAEIHRVLRPGGRAVISDIVSDRPVPQALRDDPGLWSGCISGAYEEGAFLQAFASAGFGQIEVVAAGSEPWQTLEGIEFRSLTVRAYKPGPAGPRSRASADLTQGAVRLPAVATPQGTGCCGDTGSRGQCC